MAPVGGLTFLFSDIEGSTRLVEELQTGYGLALRTCRRMLVNVLGEHGGREFGNEGDGQFFVFGSPAAAATAAVEAQARAAAAVWPDGVSLRVRMGLHCGPVRMSGGEYVGMTVHEVARICSAANGGQVLCSEPVADEVVKRCPHLAVSELGSYRLRGIATPRLLYEVHAHSADPARRPLRDAERDGGRRIVIWQRGGPDAAADRELAVSPTVDGVEAVVHRRADGDTAVFHVTVVSDGRVEEEFDGLTSGGPADAATVINANSRFVRAEWR